MPGSVIHTYSDFISVTDTVLLITTLNYYKMITHGSKEKNTTAKKGTAQLQTNRQPTERFHKPRTRHHPRGSHPQKNLQRCHLLKQQA